MFGPLNLSFKEKAVYSIDIQFRFEFLDNWQFKVKNLVKFSKKKRLQFNNK